jgi:hypothetical protein
VVQGLLALYASARYSWQEAKDREDPGVGVIGSRFAGRAAGIQATLQLITAALQQITIDLIIIDVAGVIQPGPGRQKAGV